METKIDILEALGSGSIYDYIAKYYNGLSKEELKDLCLELIYILRQDGTSTSFDEVAESLEDLWN